MRREPSEDLDQALANLPNNRRGPRLRFITPPVFLGADLGMPKRSPFTERNVVSFADNADHRRQRLTQIGWRLILVGAERKCALERRQLAPEVGVRQPLQISPLAGVQTARPYPCSFTGMLA
jgi:hypothetical protein